MGRLEKRSSKRFVLLEGRTIIGRAPGCEAILSGEKVSREHASIFFEQGCWMLRDLGSSNGTSINGSRIISPHRQALQLGDLIVFGSKDESWWFSEDSAPEDNDIAETSHTTLELKKLGLRFLLDAEGKALELSLLAPPAERLIPLRTFHQLLLVLARARLRDIEAGVAVRNQGWCSQSELIPAVCSDLASLNVYIHRARKQFEGLGVGGSEDLVQRRNSSQHLRLGVELLEIKSRARAN